MKLVLVPDWLGPLLKKGHLRYNALLDVRNLLPILSKQDVAFYIHLSHAIRNFLPEGFEELSTHVDLNITDEVVNDIWRLVLDVTEVEYPVKTAHDLLAYCGASIGNKNILPEEIAGVDVEILSVEENVYFVRLKPLADKHDLLTTYEQFLSAYSKHQPMEQVVQLSLFAAYEAALTKDVLAA